MSYEVECYNVLLDAVPSILRGSHGMRVGDYCVMVLPVAFGAVRRLDSGEAWIGCVAQCDTLGDASFYADIHDEQNYRRDAFYTCGYEVEIWHVVDDLEQVTRYDWHRFALDQARELRQGEHMIPDLSADLSWIHAQASAAPCSHSCAVCCLCNVDAGGWRLCEPYQRCELEALLGDFVDDYDVDGIEREVTAFCPMAGCVVLLPSFQGDDSLYDVLSRHCQGVTVDA